MIGGGLVEKVIVPALIAPVLAFLVAGLGIVVIYRIVGRQHPGPVTRGFRLGQIISGSLFSLSHGTNDAQKTMGIIFLALVANGNLTAQDDVPTWVVVVGGHGDRTRHLRRRLAHHPDRRDAGSSRWTRRRGSPPRASAPR